MPARRCGCGGHWQALHGTACSTTPWRTPSCWQITGEHSQQESEALQSSFKQEPWLQGRTELCEALPGAQW